MPEFPQKESEIIALADAVETEIILTDRERGKEFEHRVIAINKAGESESSNTVMAVL